jgi:hypothetical protein
MLMIVSPQAILGRYITTQTDFGRSQFPDDEDRNGPQNVGLLAIQPPDVAVSPRILLDVCFDILHPHCYWPA